MRLEQEILVHLRMCSQPKTAYCHEISDTIAVNEVDSCGGDLRIINAVSLKFWSICCKFET